ncbi:hypothetical protein PR048_020215 [Dryococelus australis]|uniref:Uncharacterized protein n=1 Tax=Dryococelus australis TaxID=614101 RepID=A0ABQ9H5P2_9NEOP|nr:hypothetical protein PR048_020215 [Dryococelus australis]
MHKRNVAIYCSKNIDIHKRMNRPMAIVEELIPGRNGKKRLVRLKTTSGVIFQSVQRMYHLEICLTGH